MGVPPNHQFISIYRWNFPYKPSSYWVPPYVLLMKSALIFSDHFLRASIPTSMARWVNRPHDMGMGHGPHILELIKTILSEMLDTVLLLLHTTNKNTMNDTISLLVIICHHESV